MAYDDALAPTYYYTGAGLDAGQANTVSWWDNFNSAVANVGAAYVAIRQADRTTAPAASQDQTPPPTNTRVQTAGGISIPTDVVILAAVGAVIWLVTRK